MVDLLLAELGTNVYGEGTFCEFCGDPVVRAAWPCKQRVGETVCLVCGGLGHSGRNCPVGYVCCRCVQRYDQQRCATCGGRAHSAEQCSSIICTQCGSRGHTSTQCVRLHFNPNNYRLGLNHSGRLGLSVLENKGCMVVMKVIPGSAAQIAGIPEGSTIVGVNGAPVATEEQLVNAVNRWRASCSIMPLMISAWPPPDRALLCRAEPPGPPPVPVPMSVGRGVKLRRKGSEERQPSVSVGRGSSLSRSGVAVERIKSVASLVADDSGSMQSDRLAGLFSNPGPRGILSVGRGVRIDAADGTLHSNTHSARRKSVVRIASINDDRSPLHSPMAARSRAESRRSRADSRRSRADSQYTSIRRGSQSPRRGSQAAGSRRGSRAGSRRGSQAYPEDDIFADTNASRSQTASVSNLQPQAKLKRGVAVVQNEMHPEVVYDMDINDSPLDICRKLGPGIIYAGSPTDPRELPDAEPVGEGHFWYSADADFEEEDEEHGEWEEEDEYSASAQTGGDFVDYSFPPRGRGGGKP
eukprot:Hpha_TRINITY_DN26148_c0_g1::TRINITY_DN26148_c0_g1_i1::g.155286::m.155286